jgi:hypothetical protein
MSQYGDATMVLGVPGDAMGLLARHLSIRLTHKRFGFKTPSATTNQPF